MKTKEFIKRVEELGYLVDDSYIYWQIRDETNLLVAIVHKNNLYRISTDFMGWWDIADEDKSKLLDIIVEFAKTPIEDRDYKEHKNKEEAEKYFKATYKNYFSLDTGLGNLKPPYSYGYSHRKYYVMTKYKFNKNFEQNFKNEVHE